MQLTAGRGDGQRAVSQLARQVEGLARRLLQRESHRVVGHRRFHRRAHLRCRAEVPVRGDEALNPLVWALEVVAVDEELQPSLAVLEVGEHRARKKLVPQCLPEALHLAQRLRVLRARLEVSNSLSPQLGLEVRRAPPRGVLPAVVGQHFAWHAITGDAALQRLHHQRALHVVRERVAHNEATAVVHEDCHVEPLVLAQEEAEDVGLPELVGLSALEAPRRRRAAQLLRRSRRQQAFLVQNPPHHRLRNGEPFEASELIGNPSRPRVRLCPLRGDHRVAPWACPFLLSLRAALARNERLDAALAKLPQPLVHRRVPDAQRLAHVVDWLPLFDDCAHHLQAKLERVNLERIPPVVRLLLPAHPVCLSGLTARGSGGKGC